MRLFGNERADDELERGLENTQESWKRGLLIAAQETGRRDTLILVVAVATLVVALVTLIVTLLE